MVKNELIKLFRNRIFLIFFVAVFLFFGFYLYWSLEIYEKSYGVVEEAPASYYRELVKELSSYTDVEKEELLLERRSELAQLAEYLFRSTEFNMTELVYQEVWDEVTRAVNYKDILSAIAKNTDTQIKRLDRGNYGALERRFMENRLKKTKAVYQGLSDITPVFYPSRGIRALVDNPITDCCCLFILLLAVFQLMTVERQNEMIILSKSTVRGRGIHGVVKALTLGILCVLVTVLLMVEGILVVGHSYPFSSFGLPIQSVYSYCTLRINIWQYICLYTLLKILFYLLCMAMFYFVCCMLRAVIPIFLVILSGGGLLLFLYMGISETSHLAPFKTFNPIALGQAGELMERYQCVNIFGIAVNRLPFAAGLLCVLTILFLTAAVKVFAVSGEKKILSDRRSFYEGKKRWSVSLTVHEFYKAFISQKLLFVLAVAAAAAYLQATPAEGETTLVDHLYYVYSSDVAGKYSDDILDYIQQKQEEIFASAFLPDVQEGEKMVYDAMQEAVSCMSEYAAYLSVHENSYYINNPAFRILTGANENTNRNNIITSMLMYAFAVICYVLTLSVDYQRGENRLVHSTTKGRWHYVGVKLLIGMFISLILLGMFWLPQLVSLLRTNGVDYIFAPAYSLQHLEWVWGKISIFAYMFMRYVARYLSLLVLMVFSYLVERKVKSSIIAIICVCAVVEIPLAVMLLG
ncbi:MAG: hypothetical protein NC548_37610 [Lachnospiraceae bacterium]|nr:hypothetical protein [Lachnospiraceae bacterium]